MVIADHGLTACTTRGLVANLLTVALAAVVASFVVSRIATSPTLAVVVGAFDPVIAVVLIATFGFGRLSISVRSRVDSRCDGVIAARRCETHDDER
jgi:hypothetical protein